MAKPKIKHTADGEIWHYSVGAVIADKGEYLLIDRKTPPLGFAGIAGHIDEGETPEQAIVREIREESGLEVKTAKLIGEEDLDWNWCNKGINHHHWYLFECEIVGKIDRNTTETKSIDWYSKTQIEKLKLEPAWQYWFKKIGVI